MGTSDGGGRSAAFDLAHSLDDLFTRIRISEAGLPTFDSRTVEPLGQGAGLPTPPSNPWVAALEQLLYTHWYSVCDEAGAEASATDERSAREPAAPGGSDLAERLSRANRARARWDHGWTLERQARDGSFTLRRGVLTRRAWPGEFATPDWSGPPMPGLPVAMLLSHESLLLQPGFYFALGTASSRELALYDLVRFYFNLRAEGAESFLGELSKRLNHYQVPYRFKCLRASEQLVRRDGAVLYVGKEHYAITADIVGAIRSPKHLRDDICPFTKRFAAGISVAEDPVGGGSFGMSRCRVLAEGISIALTHGVTDHDARIRTVLEHFCRQRIDPRSPWLNPGSFDIYDTAELN
jgi:hypothetical protein